MRALERTFFMIKPDGVRRGLQTEILRRLHTVPDLRVVRLEEAQLNRKKVEDHYSEHSDKPFFADLVSFTVSGPVVRMILEGEDVVSRVRMLMGATRLADAKVGTIRGDLGHFDASPWETIVHGSDSPESAESEIALHFGS